MKPLWVLLAAGWGPCGGGGSRPDATPTGTSSQFVIARVDQPSTSAMARMYGLDLNGDGVVDNQLGLAMATLARQAPGCANLTVSASDVVGQLDDSSPARLRLYAAPPPMSPTVGPAEADMQASGSGPSYVWHGGQGLTINVGWASSAAQVNMIDVGVSATTVGNNIATGNLAGALPMQEVANLKSALCSCLGTCGSTVDSLLAPDVTINGMPALSLGVMITAQPAHFTLSQP